MLLRYRQAFHLSDADARQEDLAVVRFWQYVSELDDDAESLDEKRRSKQTRT